MKRLQTLLMCLLFASIAACSGDEDSAKSHSDAVAQKNEEKSSLETDNTDAKGQPDGTITAEFNGDERTWYITSREVDGERHSSSEWMTFFDGSYAVVTLFGHTSPRSFLSSDEAFVVEFKVNNPQTSPQLEEPEISYLSHDFMNYYSTDGEGSASINLNEVSIDGDWMTVSGTMSGVLNFRSLNNKISADSQLDITVENGKFSATIRKP